MRNSAILPLNQSAGRGQPDNERANAFLCPLPAGARELETLGLDLFALLERTGCPLAPSLRQAREGLRTLAAKFLRAQEEERRRIAREMHDDWTQRLALLSIDLANLEKHVGAPEIAAPLLRAIQGRLVRLSEDVHALSRHLHPSILDDLGLVEALRSECASFSRREGVTITYCPQKVPSSLPKDVALCIYRVAQEALRNIGRHAGVKEGWVTLSGTAQEILLRVQDRGVGFDPEAERREPGLGLSGMEERVRLIQAKLSITSALGQGTTVEVRVPLTRSLS